MIDKIDIEDKSHRPSIAEMEALVGTPLFTALRDHMERVYSANPGVEYSGDRVLLGWNLKYRKAGRTLCTVYPRAGHFFLLLVVGAKEKAQTEALLPALSPAFRQVYNDTQEGMGQRWMLFDFSSPSPAFDDVLQIVRIRRQSSLRKSDNV